MGIYIPGLKGNATVPGGAPIQPPQAFVDNIAQFVGTAGASDLALSGKGLTKMILTDPIFANWLTFIDGSGLDFSNNSLDATSVNSILSAIVNGGGILGDGGNLNLSGGTNAAPTGQGIIDKATLIAATWTVSTN